MIILMKLIGEETIDGRLCYKIKMIAKEDAAVVWGHQIRWIDKKDFLVLKAELYDEDGSLVRTETGSEIKKWMAGQFHQGLNLFLQKNLGIKPL